MEIITVQDYEKALLRLINLMNAKPNTPEGKELDELANDVMEYEALTENW